MDGVTATKSIPSTSRRVASCHVLTIPPAGPNCRFQAWLAAAVLLAAPLAHVCAAPPPTLDSVAECVGAARNNHMALLPGADGGAGHLITNHCVSGDCGEPDYVLGPAGHHYWIVGNAADAAERDFNSCDTVPDTCFNGMHDSGEDSTDVGGVCPVPPCGGFFLDNAPGVVHGPVAGDNSACRGVVGAHAADARSSVYFIRVPEASVLTFEIDGWEGECIGSISGYDSQLSFFEGTTNVSRRQRCMHFADEGSHT